jgi:tRNA-dihydrouridine synthase
MNGITDQPFRHMQKKHGRPALLYTEFTAVERLEIGDRDLLKDFLYDESQRPIVAQIYGRTPALFRRMAVLCCELGFDGIDINMGCPAPSVVHRGSGAGLIRTPDLARAIIAATRAGIADWQNGATLSDDRGVPTAFAAAVEARRARLPAAYQQRRAIPVSVKTRIGYERPQVEEWIPRVLESEPAALALHGRTLRQGYAGHADWEAIGRAADLARGTRTLMLGNGDVASLDDAHQKTASYGLDGVLIGRAAYGNPFVFGPAHGAAPRDILRPLHLALEHARLYEATFGRLPHYRFIPMRKHLSWYVRSMPSASHLRRELVHANSLADVEAIVERYLQRAAAWSGSGQALPALAG